MCVRTALRTFYGGFLENRYSRVKFISFIKLLFQPNQVLEHVKLCIVDSPNKILTVRKLLINITGGKGHCDVLNRHMLLNSF